MTRAEIAAVAAILAFGSSAIIAVEPAAAQVTYGAWSNTGDCRNARVTNGLGGSAEVPSFTPVQRCLWSRDVISCPRIRDNLRHPIRCSTRRQTMWSISQPPG